MSGSRLRRLLIVASLTLATLAASHELIYLLAHGSGQEYAAVMSERGHDQYWLSFVVIVLAGSGCLASVAVVQLLRLRRLARSATTGGVRVADGGWRRLLELLGGTWVRISIFSTGVFFAQENLEMASTGASLPGFSVVTGEQAVALPVILIVSALVATVGALAGWSREVLLATIRRATMHPTRPEALPRPGGSQQRLPSLLATHKNRVRAPPARVANIA